MKLLSFTLFLTLFVAAGCQSQSTGSTIQPSLLTRQQGLALEQVALSFWEGEFAQLQSSGRLTPAQIAVINALDTAAQAAITKASADINAGGTVSQADNDAMVAAIGALAEALPSL